MNTYAAYTDAGIWATGPTPEDALENYFRATGADRAEHTVLTAPMTSTLAERVEQQGFDCQRDTFTILADGTLGIG
jgi:hypothetical protein